MNPEGEEQKFRRIGLNSEVTWTRCGCNMAFGYEAVGEHHKSGCVMHPNNVISTLQQQVTDKVERIRILEEVLLRARKWVGHNGQVDPEDRERYPQRSAVLREIDSLIPPEQTNES